MFISLYKFLHSANYAATNNLSPSLAANASGSNQHRRKSAIEFTSNLKASKSGNPLGEGSKVRE